MFRQKFIDNYREKAGHSLVTRRVSEGPGVVRFSLVRDSQAGWISIVARSLAHPSGYKKPPHKERNIKTSALAQQIPTSLLARLVAIRGGCCWPIAARVIQGRGLTHRLRRSPAAMRRIISSGI